MIVLNDGINHVFKDIYQLISPERIQQPVLIMTIRGYRPTVSFDSGFYFVIFYCIKLNSLLFIYIYHFILDTHSRKRIYFSFKDDHPKWIKQLLFVVDDDPLGHSRTRQ